MVTPLGKANTIFEMCIRDSLSGIVPFGAAFCKRIDFPLAVIASHPFLSLIHIYPAGKGEGTHRYHGGRRRQRLPGSVGGGRGHRHLHRRGYRQGDR